ncbi:MAG: glycosyltransferase family 2 protein [Candidatus Omnitrophica bacterium]|nr:glycosyltransferase family 2 protein [Candidatus Omnitrophota bacterium]
MMTNLSLYSVIVCTHNRASLLDRCLIALLNQDFSGLYEVIVVNNASTDQTGQLAQNYAENSGGKIRYFFEAHLGKSYALNQAIGAAKGGILLFTDDDVMVPDNWVSAMNASFQTQSVDGVGGKIFPRWMVDPADWLSEELYPNLALIDYGNESFNLDFDRPYYGANMAFRKSVFEKIGNFRTDLGRRGKLLLGNEDTEFCKRALSQGFRLIYDPNVIVYHRVDRDRTNKDYFRKFHFRSGETMVLAKRDRGKGYRTLLGIPVWRLKEYLCAVPNWIMNKLLRCERRAFLDELKIFEAFGYLNGLRKQCRGQDDSG